MSYKNSCRLNKNFPIFKRFVPILKNKQEIELQQKKSQGISFCNPSFLCVSQQKSLATSVESKRWREGINRVIIDGMY